MKRKGAKKQQQSASNRRRQLAIGDYRDPKLFKDIIQAYLIKYLDVNTYIMLKNTCRFFYTTLLISDHQSYNRLLSYYNNDPPAKFSTVCNDASDLFWYLLYRGFICNMKLPVKSNPDDLSEWKLLANF